MSHVAGEVEVVRRAYEAFNRGGPEAALGLLDSSVEWHDIADQPEAAVHHGHDGFLEGFGVFLQPFDTYQAEPEEMEDLGEDVLVIERHWGRGRDSGVEFSQRFASIWTVREGKVTRARFYRDRSEALEAVGLRE